MVDNGGQCAVIPVHHHMRGDTVATVIACRARGGSLPGEMLKEEFLAEYDGPVTQPPPNRVYPEITADPAQTKDVVFSCPAKEASRLIP